MKPGRVLVITCLSSLVICASLSVEGAEFAGVVVKPELLPSEAVAPIDIDITKLEFEARVKGGGTIVLDGNELEIGPIDPKEKKTMFLAVDKLVLKNGARIVTHGHRLVLIANTLASQRGEIVAFRKDEKTAPSGANGKDAGDSGQPGTNGISAGLVSLHIIDRIDGHLNVDLSGQNGGNGGDGKKGAKGGTGGHGRNAQAEVGAFGVGIGCRSGPGRGGSGKRGFPGGDAGIAGAGGEGGVFELYNVGPKPIPSSTYTVTTKGGKAGTHGKPGAGGDGGDGGHGGRGHNACRGPDGLGSGGGTGPTGPVGEEGETPSAKVYDGADGTTIAKNLDLEFIIRRVVAKTAADQEVELTP